MELLDMLRKLGDRLGIIEFSSASPQPSVPAKIQTRTLTLTELVMNIQITEVRVLAELGAELPVSFEEVFKAAGIQPGSTGWTVDRLQEFLSSERIRQMDRAEAQRETLRMLAAEKVDAAFCILSGCLKRRSSFDLLRRNGVLREIRDSDYGNICAK